jgi:hypothetical protein
MPWVANEQGAINEGFKLLTALTKLSAAGPTPRKCAPEAGAPVEKRLQNIITLTTGLCNDEQEIAKLRSATPSRYTMRPPARSDGR